MKVPDIAIRWILKYSCDTNSNLAAISNVDQHWRSVTCDVLHEFLMNALPPTSLSGNSEYELFSALLLPEMALEILRRTQKEHYKLNEIPMNDSSSFCLAWFPPKGIKVQAVNLNAFSDEELFSSDSGSSEEDENDEMAFYRQRFQHRANDISKSWKSSDDAIQNCSNEWQGYRSAIDILLPLGYSTGFIKSIVDLALSLSSSDHKTLRGSNNERETTFAVRGAVFARPHLFCLCWDADHAESKLTTHLSNLDQDEYEQTRNNYRLMDLKRRKRMHDKMRRTKMKEALPRVVMSTTVKNFALQDPTFGLLEGRRQRSLQFLNADRSRAVYLRTPPFDCGPVQGPITMFCVGIATEDGCFVSGLNTRFELGHLHGIDEMDKSIDMSPICACAENSVPENTGGSFEACNIKSYSSDSSDSSSDDYQIKRKGSIFCQCKIQYQKSKDDNSSEEQSVCPPPPNQRNIYRGQIGPGRWHCYTAIFDGNNSMIRVDGCTEKINNSSSKSIAGAMPSLDGLTIGSDHCFEMPLCFGEGSDGEGEGSIAELAVFRGAMPTQDIECYERHLMKKHGIVHGQQKLFPLEENNPVVEHIGNHWQEDLWRRQAHALISHPPHHEAGPMSIPLRVAATHKSVAWHRSNDVTGKSVRVSRIGSRQSNGSSDW